MTSREPLPGDQQLRQQPSADLANRVRAALTAAGYTYDGVSSQLGELAHSALGRSETTPARLRTSDGSPLSTLIRLFILQLPVDIDRAEAALPGMVDELCKAGLLERSVGEVVALMDIRPYADDSHDLWVLSDLTPGLDGGPQRIGRDHVLGISGAATSLTQQTIRRPVARALDLGTGCGVQALHLAAHADHVVATDVNARALWITRFNAALNGVALDVRDGSFFEPVADERYDLIVTNPPFVISPATGERLVYRDSGLPGDQVVEHIVRSAPRHLTDGGWCQILANWVIARDQPWEQRLTEWIEHPTTAPGQPLSSDALVIQREVLDPASYVELWLKDAGHHGGPDYIRRYDTWLSWLEEQGVEGIGFGWINLRRLGSGSRPAVIRCQEWPYEVEQPIAPAIADWGDAVEWLGATGGSDEALLGATLKARADVRQETDGQPGAEDPETIVLRQQRGFRRARKADTVEAALVGASDGELTSGQILDAVAGLLGRDADQVRTTYAPAVRDLVADGFLKPA